LNLRIIEFRTQPFSIPKKKEFGKIGWAMYFIGYCTLFFNMDGKVLGEMRRGLLEKAKEGDSYPSPRGWSRTNFFEKNLEWDWGETRIL